jgi:hypothetical protein
MLCTKSLYSTPELSYVLGYYIKILGVIFGAMRHSLSRMHICLSLVFNMPLTNSNGYGILPARPDIKFSSGYYFITDSTQEICWEGSKCIFNATIVQLWIVSMKKL